ncbi:MAG: hypothetical protein H0U52_12765 [Chloroflexi bacterium]|nr:hypothetical protein [Chloroflexota bacterium]
MSKGAVKAISFREPVKHGRVLLPMNTPVAFEDPDAAPYFLNAGWASETAEEPVLTYSAEEIEVDPETVHANTTRKVMDGPLDQPAGA